jgi:hypothetical protein
LNRLAAAAQQEAKPLFERAAKMLASTDEAVQAEGRALLRKHQAARLATGALGLGALGVGAKGVSSGLSHMLNVPKQADDSTVQFLRNVVIKIAEHQQRKEAAGSILSAQIQARTRPKSRRRRQTRDDTKFLEQVTDKLPPSARRRVRQRQAARNKVKDLFQRAGLRR